MAANQLVFPKITRIFTAMKWECDETTAINQWRGSDQIQVLVLHMFIK